MDFLKRVLELRDPLLLVPWAGYPGMTLIIFLETGALVFFLPGDSMLFVAGMFAGTEQFGLNIWILNALLIPAAIIGDAVSYTIGARTGPAVFNKPDSRWFKPEHMKSAHDFYEKHGGKAIILARFAPIVRTFVPVVAGVAKMPYSRFATYNIVGAALWVISMTFGGYFLGQFDVVRKNIELIVVGIIVVSLVPAVLGAMRSRGAKAAGVKADKADSVKA